MSGTTLEERARQSASDPLRRPAATRFAALGFPTARDEAWRYTNVAPIAKLQFSDETAAEALEVPAALAAEAQLVFHNGRYLAELSGRPPDGVTVGPGLGQVASFDAHAFVALNTALARGGTSIRVTGKVSAPLRVLHLSDARHGTIMAQPRVSIVLDAGAEATVIERYAALAGASTSDVAATEALTNTVVELDVGAGAALRWTKWQDEATATYHVAGIWTRLGKGAQLDLTSLAFGGRLARTEVHVTLGEGASVALRGLAVAGQDQAQEALTFVDHQLPHGKSRQLFKGVLAGNGRALYDGSVRVAPGAQKTDAGQKNQNLLLSKDASAVSKPHLEIYADDVKCAHGATSGQLSPDALFYLRARGIDEAEARLLLARGFAGEIVDTLQDEALRQEAYARLGALA